MAAEPGPAALTPLTAPVAEAERVETLDVLRGLAVLGILAMNIRAMAAPFSAYMYPHALFDHTGASRAAYILTSVVFDMKMMGLFSMLFGAGVLLYASKPARAGRPPRGLWFRRMFWLLTLGLGHAYLIWDGDILVPYATCGLLFLWWVRRLPAWALLVGGTGMLLVGNLMWLGFGTGWEAMPEAARAEQAEMWMPTREQALAQAEAMRGSYLEIVAHRAPSVLSSQTFVFLMFFLWRCGGMMLLGMALLKLGVLDGRRSVAFYAVLGAVGASVGLAMASKGVAELEAVGYAMPGRTLADQWNYAGSVPASIGYAALLALLVKRRWLRVVTRALAAVGRMAFTNYLAQSVIGSVLFLGWGLGLVGRLDYAAQLGVVGAVWALQLIASPLWLRRYHFGPAEWLWRSLTYWRPQPMRRTTPAPGRPPG